MMNSLLEVVEEKYLDYKINGVGLAPDIDISKNIFLPVGEKVVMISTKNVINRFYETMCFVVDLKAEDVDKASLDKVLWDEEVGLERTEGLDINQARINHMKAIRFFEEMNKHYVGIK